MPASHPSRRWSSPRGPRGKRTRAGVPPPGQVPGVPIFGAHRNWGIIRFVRSHGGGHGRRPGLYVVARNEIAGRTAAGLLRSVIETSLSPWTGPFMRNPTLANTKRAKQAHALPSLEGPSLESTDGEGFDLIVDDAAFRAGALDPVARRRQRCRAAGGWAVRVRDRSGQGPPVAIAQAVRAGRPCARDRAHGWRADPWPAGSQPGDSCHSRVSRAMALPDLQTQCDRWELAAQRDRWRLAVLSRETRRGPHGG
jgi:hypothetical protein